MDWLEKEVLILTYTEHIEYYKDIDPDYTKVKDEKITIYLDKRK